MKDKITKLYTDAAVNAARLLDPKGYKIGIDPQTVTENLKRASDKTFDVASKNLKIAGDIAVEKLAIARGYAGDIANRAEVVAKDVVDKVKETTKKAK